MGKNKLKRCPFCGSVAWIAKLRNGWSVGCNSEKCLLDIHADNFTSQDQALKAWNKRYKEKE